MQLPLNLFSALVILSLTLPQVPNEPTCKHGAHDNRVAILPVQEVIPIGNIYCRIRGPVFPVRQSPSTFFDSSSQFACSPRIEFGQIEDLHAESCFELITRYAQTRNESAAPVLYDCNSSVVLARWQGNIAPYLQTELIPAPGVLHLRRSPFDHFELTWSGNGFQLLVYRKVKVPLRCVVNRPAAVLDETIDLKARRFEHVLVLEPDKMRGLIKLLVVIESSGTVSTTTDGTFARGFKMPDSIVLPNWELQFETDADWYNVTDSYFAEADLSPVWLASKPKDAIGKSLRARPIQAGKNQSNRSPTFERVAPDAGVQRDWVNVR